MPRHGKLSPGTGKGGEPERAGWGVPADASAMPA